LRTRNKGQSAQRTKAIVSELCISVRTQHTFHILCSRYLPVDDVFPVIFDHILLSVTQLQKSISAQDLSLALDLSADN